ncbi:hypothetical protein [Paraburkholderia sp. BL10I2N1]|uniref:hypothetical protein n=1 Tax=Paraburkholderia sp. BL10I2N1 TaxID=1938796 RepID=UPI00105ECC35|nr:hypothetical protein [Paraburkholderia sp. BL10I2N1]TDN59035.1 hypothetical protein B0G77_8221 [Paraburkholderia sp. BL10I2N1]
MAKTISFRQSPQAARARKNRTLLLSMPRASADDLALRVHVALDALSRGCGNVHAAQTLTQTMILTGFLAEAGYGEATFEQMQQAEADISGAFDRGRASGEWQLDDAAAARFAVIASTYDYQLQRAPLWAVADASDRLDRFVSGESFDRVIRKRA